MRTLTELAVAAVVVLSAICSAAEIRADDLLVDISVACPGILVELRYATARNITGARVYPRAARALIRPGTAARLAAAQARLWEMGYQLKIWDAYRPAFAQEALWIARPHPEFVAAPGRGGSLHERGVAVDVTLVNRAAGKEALMPTDFDQFGPSAARRYRGENAEIAANLAALQTAMTQAGFLAMRDEWWHFVDKDYRAYSRVTPPPQLVSAADE